MRRLLLFALLIALLAACGDTPNVLPTLAPNDQAAVDSNETAPTVVVENRVQVPGRLLFINDDNIMVAAGENTQFVTQSGKKRQPTWSPDGSRLAYIQREESYADLWVMTDDGADKVRITYNEPPGIEARSETHVRSVTWSFYPAWSPDGALLAFVGQAAPPQGAGEVPFEFPLSLYLYGAQRIATNTPADASFQQLALPDTDITHPEWAADSNTVIFVQTNRALSESTPELGFFAYDTGAYGKLQGSDPAMFDNTMDPDVSADGRWLTYVKREEGQSNIYVVRAPAADGSVTGTPQRLATGLLRMPTFAPDGRHIAFFEAKNNSVSLVIANLETAAAGQLSLADVRDVWSGAIDIDSGMDWNQ